MSGGTNIKISFPDFDVSAGTHGADLADRIYDDESTETIRDEEHARAEMAKASLAFERIALVCSKNRPSRLSD